MKIIRSLTKIPKLSLALGFFDGMHLGHQAVIMDAKSFATENNLQTGIVTFDKHPAFFINPQNQIKYIIPTEEKYYYISNLGIDYVIELPFESIKDKSAQEYIELLHEYFSPAFISTGFNHHFGANREGNVETLSDYQEKYDYIYSMTMPKTVFGDVISSTAIRRAIQTGDIFEANSMLGKKFHIRGTVIKGLQLGRTIGFPTANIIYPQNIVAPAYGVYGVNVFLNNALNKLPAIANFGIRPTVNDDEKPLLEVYIPNFNGDLYGQEIIVEFTKMIRPETKFLSLEELKIQIELDIQKIL